MHFSVNNKTRNEVEPPGTNWNYQKQTTITWNELEPPGTRWAQQPTVTKNKTFRGGDCESNTAAQ